MKDIFSSNVLINGYNAIQANLNIAFETIKEYLLYFLNYFLDIECYLIYSVLIISVLVFIGTLAYFCIKNRTFDSDQFGDGLVILLVVYFVMFGVLPFIHLAISLIYTYFSLDNQLLQLYENKVQINFVITILWIITIILRVLKEFAESSYINENVQRVVLRYTGLFILSYCLFQYLPFYLFSSLNNVNIFYISHIKIFIFLLAGLDSLVGYYILNSKFETI